MKPMRVTRDNVMRCGNCGGRRRFLQSRPKHHWRQPTLILFCMKCDGTGASTGKPINATLNFVEEK